jgi:protein gp37
MQSERYWRLPYAWDRSAQSSGGARRVFCASMGDVLEEHSAVEAARQRLWRVIEETPRLTWQLLTKRPENFLRLTPPAWRERWPANVWAMATAENQLQASLRCAWLIELRERAGARVIGVSAEPLLGAIRFRSLADLDERAVAAMLGVTHPAAEATALARRWKALRAEHARRYGDGATIDALGHGLIDWLVVGGESGPHHRPLDLDAARALRDDCIATRTAFFFKQHGGRRPTTGGRLLDGREWNEFPTEPENAPAARPLARLAGLG